MSNPGPGQVPKSHIGIVQTSRKTADIIKFFNSKVDGSSGKLSVIERSPSHSSHHLAATPGNCCYISTHPTALLTNNISQSTPSSMEQEREEVVVEEEEGPEVRGRAVGSLTRHGGTKLAPAATTSSRVVETTGCGGEVEQCRFHLYSPAGAITGRESRDIPPRIIHPTVQLFESDSSEEFHTLGSDSESDQEEVKTIAEKWSPYKNGVGCSVDDRFVRLPITNVSNRYSGGEDPQHMGEEKRIGFVNVSSESDIRGYGRASRNRRGAADTSRVLVTGGSAGGDSDGMMGSEGESDSSEEIHYGPGFVSRLKSRYMSVALRGTARCSLGPLRRTASLEDFLELEKAEADQGVEAEREAGRTEVISPVTKTKIKNNGNATPNYSSYHSTKARSRIESMKRAKSVEVLSVLSDLNTSVGRDEEVLPDSFFNAETVPPSELPPPLPPRERHDKPVHSLLTSAPALVNNCVVIEQKSDPKVNINSLPKSEPVAAVRKAGPEKPHLDKKVLKKRSSASVLFGVKDKELPAPDTVKETRKLFEGSVGLSGEKKIQLPSSGLTKALSTSSLYSKAPTNPTSMDRSDHIGRKTYQEERQRPPWNSNIAKTAPKKYSPKSTRSPSPKYTSVYSQNRGLGTNFNKNTSSPYSSNRPSIPAKPSHLSPIVNGKSSVYKSALVERNLKRDSGTAKPIPSYPVKPLARGEDTVKSVANEVDAIRLNLQPIKPLKEKGEEDTPPRTPPREVSDTEEGTKVISEVSRQNIRRDGNVINFDFSGSNAKSPSPILETIATKQVPKEEETLKKPRENNSVISKHKAPPVIPPRNGSKLEHATILEEKKPFEISPARLRNNNNNQPTKTKCEESSVNKSRIQEKYFDTNIEPQPSPPTYKKVEAVNEGFKSDVIISDMAAPEDDTDKSGKSNYRENWKARQEQQNTLVFNFINSKKDVSHIENDGLDLSKRVLNVKKGVLYIDTNGESCDGASDGEKDDADLSAQKFIFVGADIKTGKSSLRSKISSKKLSIKFNDETEVFEYPSFESCGDESTAPSSLKTNTALRSSGGLGSYTPSKIQISDSPFQLGVSRTPSNTTTHASQDKPVVPSPSTTTTQQSYSTDPFLLPADEGISWGNTQTSDMLF